MPVIRSDVLLIYRFGEWRRVVQIRDAGSFPCYVDAAD
jgi:hypothetical protein